MSVSAKTRYRSTVLSAITVVGMLGTGLAIADGKVALSGKEEVPAVTTTATGAAEIKIGADKKVSGHVHTKDIEGIAAHIHLGAVGENGPPVVTLVKGADGTWDVPADATLTDEQYAAYKAGKLYVNVHSAAHKPGEIRAQLKP